MLASLRSAAATAGSAEAFRKLDAGVLRDTVDALFVFAVTYTVGGTAATATGRAAIAGLLHAAVCGKLGDYTSPTGACMAASGGRCRANM